MQGLLHAQGPHPIGFADTLLVNDSLPYAAFGYEGPAPLFVQAWFPLGGTIASPEGRLDPNNLRFHELRRPKLPPPGSTCDQRFLATTWNRCQCFGLRTSGGSSFSSTRRSSMSKPSSSASTCSRE